MMGRSIFISIVFFASAVFAAPTLTLQGRILKPDGSPLNENSTQFRVRVLSPQSDRCILYDETQTLNLQGADGLFTFTLNSGAGTRNDTSNTHGFAAAFSNLKDFVVDGSLCAAGSGTVTYTPGADDERKVIVYFKSPSMSTWEQMPETRFTSTAFALQAREVGGFGADALCRVADASGPQSVAPLTPADFTELQALLAGTSTKYTKTSSGAAGLPLLSANPGTLSKGQIWYDSGSNTIKFYNGSVQTVGASGAGLSSVTVGSGLTADGTEAGTLSAPGTIALKDTGVTANTYGSATQIPVFAVNAQGRITSVANTAISGAAPTGSAGGDLNGSYPSPTIKDGAVTTSKMFSPLATVTRLVSVGGVAGETVAPFTCAIGQTLAWDATNGWVCAAGWQNATAGVLYTTAGNVGIGTTSPARKMELKQIDSDNALLRLTSLPSVAGTSYESALEFYTSTTTAVTPFLSGRISSNFTGTSYTNTVLKLQNATTGGVLVDTMVLNNGKVGIGTAAPGDQLSVGPYETPAVTINQDKTIAVYGAGAAYFRGRDVTNDIEFIMGTSSAGEAFAGAMTVHDFSLRTNNNARMTIKASGNIGIGTASPVSILSNHSSNMLDSASSGTNGTALSWSSPGTGYAGGFFNSSTGGGLLVKAATTTGPVFSVDQGTSAAAAGTALFRVLGSGYVGIGTTSPGYPLEVKAAGNQFALSATNTKTIFNLFDGGTGNDAMFDISPSTGTGTSDAAVRLFRQTTTTGARYFQIFKGDGTNTADSSITVGGTTFFNASGGNVGIGTTSPGARLSLGTGQSNKKLFLWENGTDAIGLGVASSEMRIFTANSGTNHISFGKYGLSTDSFSETMRIDHNGNLGIGTSAPSSKLHVYGSSPALRVQSSASNDGIIAIRNVTNTDVFSMSTDTSGISSLSSLGYMNLNASGATSQMIFKTGGGTERMRITDSGNIGIGVTSPQATLDVNGYARLKTNASAPATCSATNAGALAMTSKFTLCACNGAGWVSTNDGTTTCVWN